MEPDDPLVTAALYYSHEMRDAGKAVTADLQQAADDLRAAAQLALTANGAADSVRTKVMRDIEAQIVRSIKVVVSDNYLGR